MSVIVAVDGSELSTRAVVAGLALLGNVSDAVIVTVVESGDPMEVTGTGMAGGTMSTEEFDEHERTRAADGTQIVRDAATVLRLADAQTRVVRGSPGAALCDLADELSARTIVIGSRGHGGFKRALLGSVSDYVLRNAPCSVVVTASA